MTLYELSSAYQELLQQIEAGEVPEEALADTLEAVEGELSDKLDSYACIIKTLTGEAAAIKAEADALTKRAQAKTKAVQRMKTYIGDIMTVNGLDKLETARNLVKFTKSSQVEVADTFISWAEQNADDLIRYKDPEPDKTAIKQAIKDGRVPAEQAHITENRNISVK